MLCQGRGLSTPRAARGARPCTHRIGAVRTPSNQTGSNLLSELSKWTTFLPNSTLSPEKMTIPDSSAAIVNSQLISHILANTGAFYEFENAIEKGVARAASEAPGDSAVAIVNAFSNVAVMLSEVAPEIGKIAIEVDPRLASSSDELKERSKLTVETCGSLGLEPSKLLLQIPGTWAGIQAAKALQESGIDCEITSVYSSAQAAAAVHASAAALVLNITHINLWYDRHPGAIRNPQGPRQDAGLSSDINMGVTTVKAIYSLAQQQGACTRLIVTGLRTPEEVLALSGIDYMHVPDSILKQLEARGTLDGYNDGLSASMPTDSSGVPALTPEKILKEEALGNSLAIVDETAFTQELGMAGEALLKDQISSDSKLTNQVEQLISAMVVARE